MGILDDPYLFASESPVDLGLAMAAVRRELPVYWDEVRQAWVVMRYDDVDYALRNPQLFSNTIYDTAALAGTFSALDGPDHLRHRRLFAPAFSARSVARYQAEVVEPAVERMVARLRDRQAGELVSDVCLPLPVEVIAPLLGMSPEDLDPCRLWVNQLVAWNMYRKDPEVAAIGRTAYDQVREHVRPLLERQSAAPEDNLLGAVVRAYQEAGEFDFDEMLVFTVGLVIGGFETTTWMLACALGALLLHPDALDEVRRDRSLLPAALEESMRWSPSFVGVLRHTTADVTLSGVTIPAHSDVVLCQASAHFDDERFTDPQIFDIHRKPEHLLFAAGPHYCLGAPLARLEARIAISRLLDELPGLRLVPGTEHPFVLGALGSAMHGPTSLHVEWDAPPEHRMMTTSRRWHSATS